MKYKTLFCAAAVGVMAATSAMAANWNHYNQSPNWAVSSMHQGVFTADYVPSVSIDVYNPPIYVLSASARLVTENGQKSEAIGRATYRLNYATKSVEILDLTGATPVWKPLPSNNPQEQAAINKLFQKAYGMPFFK